MVVRTIPYIPLLSLLCLISDGPLIVNLVSVTMTLGHFFTNHDVYMNMPPIGQMDEKRIDYKVIR